MVNVEKQETNTEIALLDISGTKLLGWTAEKEYSSVIVSSPEIQQGETYTLKTGTAEQNITMDSLVYGESFSEGGMSRKQWWRKRRQERRRYAGQARKRTRTAYETMFKNCIDTSL